MIAVKVRWATGIVGLRKIGTAFETASTPVIAVQPLANALSSKRGHERADARGDTDRDVEDAAMSRGRLREQS